MIQKAKYYPSITHGINIFMLKTSPAMSFFTALKDPEDLYRIVGGTPNSTQLFGIYK